jgi:hypothetical protein
MIWCDKSSPLTGIVNGCKFGPPFSHRLEPGKGILEIGVVEDEAIQEQGDLLLTRKIPVAVASRHVLVGLDQWETDTLDQEYDFHDLVEVLNRIGELQKRFADIFQGLPPVIRIHCPQCNGRLETVSPGVRGEVVCSNCRKRLPLVASSVNPGG